ncbi:hypothetical protein LLID5_19400 [Lactococcus lactis]|nr:hypothetical protein LLID5_19400 [Lactococcus lactis]
MTVQNADGTTTLFFAGYASATDQKGNSLQNTESAACGGIPCRAMFTAPLTWNWNKPVIGIDDTAPTGSVSYSTTAWTNQNVTVTLNTDKAVTTPSGWTKVDDTHYTRNFAKKASGNAKICDSYNVCSTIAYSIANIDKTKPVITVNNSDTTCYVEVKTPFSLNPDP